LVADEALLERTEATLGFAVFVMAPLLLDLESPIMHRFCAGHALLELLHQHDCTCALFYYLVLLGLHRLHDLRDGLGAGLVASCHLLELILEAEYDPVLGFLFAL
jgi:hypothetical protein